MTGAHDDSGTHQHAGRVPFWVHQLVELLLGGLLLVEGARTGEHTVVLVSFGAALLLLALCSEGALGAWTWIGRRLHRVLDLAAAAMLAVSPVVLGLDQVLAIVILEAAAVAMLWLAFRTEWRPRPKRARRTRPGRTLPGRTSVDGAAAPSTGPTTRPPTPAPTTAPRSPSPASPEAVPLARTLGTAARRARDDGPRQLGRWVGRAQRAAKVALAPAPSPPVPTPETPTTPAGPPDAPPQEPPSSPTPPPAPS